MQGAELELDSLLEASASNMRDEEDDGDQAELAEWESDDDEASSPYDESVEYAETPYADLANSEYEAQAEEEALAYELMTIGDEAEMEEFLGKLIGAASRGLRKLKKRALPSLGALMRGPAGALLKRAMPLLGSSLGSVIPGAGTLVGGFAGQKLGQLLGGEMEQASDEEARLDLSRRLVNTVSEALREAAENPHADAQPEQVLRDSLVGAMQSHLPEPVRQALGRAGKGRGERARSGRWIRRGNSIVLLGA